MESGNNKLLQIWCPYFATINCLIQKLPNDLWHITKYIILLQLTLYISHNHIRIRNYVTGSIYIALILSY
jgi:hypothetical protein